MSLIERGLPPPDRYHQGAAFAVLLAVAVSIACFDLRSSGPLWPDGPQYANAGAMIRDWLRSGHFLHPYEFAKNNYARYPVFHIPYHPPGYPALLGLFFLVTGVSYSAARVFIALCLWTAACFFFLILTRSGIRKTAAIGASLLFLTTPDIAFWSRDTMSEIPGLAFIMAGTYFLIRWISSAGTSLYIVAFLFAEAAFLSRYLTAGVLPGWFLIAGFAGKFRRRLSPALFLPPVVYLIANGCWIVFTRQWSAYEAGFGAAGPNRNYGGYFHWPVMSFYLHAIPNITGWFLLLAAGLGGAVTLLSGRTALHLRCLWLFWIASYCAFVLAVGIYGESRYLIYALPGVSGLAAALLNIRGDRLNRVERCILALFLACLAENVQAIAGFPRGVVGYEEVGRRLAQLKDRGNILVYSVEQADLVFRYRSNQPSVARSVIRGDRSLAIRAPGYSNVLPQILVHGGADVLEVIRRGRIRYVVTSSPAGQNDGAVQVPEVRLLREVMGSRSDNFHKLSEFPLSVQYGSAVLRFNIDLWEYMGELPGGPSEIPIVVPTAGLLIDNKQP